MCRNFAIKTEFRQNCHVSCHDECYIFNCFPHFEDLILHNLNDTSIFYKWQKIHIQYGKSGKNSLKLLYRIRF